MKWKPCDKSDCMYYQAGEADIVVEYKHEKVRMTFSGLANDHPGIQQHSSTAWLPYPCNVCKHYEPRKLDLYKPRKEEKA